MNCFEQGLILSRFGERKDIIQILRKEWYFLGLDEEMILSRFGGKHDII